MWKYINFGYKLVIDYHYQLGETANHCAFTEGQLKVIPQSLIKIS